MASPMASGRRRIAVYINAGVALELLAQPGESIPFHSQNGLEPSEWRIERRVAFEDIDGGDIDKVFINKVPGDLVAADHIGGVCGYFFWE